MWWRVLVVGVVRVLVFVLAGALLAFAGPAVASAAVGHRFLSGWGEASAGTLLGRPDVVAVDGVSGDVFVGDPASGMVDVYSSGGVFLTQFGGGMLAPVGVAVDEATGVVYVADAAADGVRVYKPDGAGGYGLLARWSGGDLAGGEFGEVAGVAVDNSASVSAGDVYVVDAGDVKLNEGVVDVFKPAGPGVGEGGEGSLVRVLSAGKMRERDSEPDGVAVSSATGRVLVADSVEGAVYAFSAEGVYEEALTGKGSPYGAFIKGEGVRVGDVAGVAVEAGSGDVYVAEAERHVVSQYGASGEWLGWIASTPTGALQQPLGVAVNLSGEVYVADAGAGRIDRFGVGVSVPSVVTGKAAKAKLARESAVVKGVVNGAGEAVEYRFQYGETEALGSETALTAADGSEQTVEATLDGLHAGRTYYYRVLAQDGNGVAVGAILVLQSAPAVEGVSTGPVQELEPDSVTLTGSLLPGGVDAHYRFQWGATRAYGGESPAAPGTDAGSGSEVVSAQAELQGLAPDTTYHYRLLVENSYGVSYGEDGTFTTPGAPRVTSLAVTGVGQEQASVHALVDPDRLATSYRFEYGETTAYGEQAPEGGEVIGSGATPLERSVTLSHLKLGVTYHFRVVAENEAGVTYGSDQTFSTLAAASVDETFATGVGTSSATLGAEIDPLGRDTDYYFQYGTQDCQAQPGMCTYTPAPPGEDIGAGETDREVTESLTGLVPETTYYFRVVASNELGVSEGPERTFTTASQVLPDNRAWEMVTPPEKGSAPVEALTREGGWIRAAEDGEALTYVADGALGEEAQANRSPEMQQLLATRTARGWSSQDIMPPSSRAKGIKPGNTPEYQYFSADLGSALVEPVQLGNLPEPPLAEGVKQPTMYLRDDTTGSYLPLVTEENTAQGTHFGNRLHFLAATPDLSHVLIQSEVALNGEGSAPGLYEWSAGRPAAEELQLVSVLPDGRPATRGSLRLGFWNTQANAMSTDGSRVIWTVVGTEEGSEELGRLYLRDTAAGETVRLDAAQGVFEARGAGGRARFQGASADGSRVFFTDKLRLTPGSTAEASSGPGKPDLYECEMVEEAGGGLACELKDLTVDENEEQHADVQGSVLATSEDGKSVYLIAQGVLANNENGNGEVAVNGADNLYALHEAGGVWTRTFIATLSAADAPEWEGNGDANTAYLTARSSPNGRYLAFMSAAPITGYDNVDASPVANGARDEEVYLYDSAGASLTCVSCDPAGAPPHGVLDTERSGEGLGLLVDRRLVWGSEGDEHWLAGSIPGWTAQNLVSALYQSRYLSDEGRLYFDSPADLVPAASNGKENVYEYEPSGVGSCESSSGGCVALISGGSSDRESAFLEATPDGSNVFFLTEAQLLAQDTDTAFDIYDARECTQASPCLSPPAAREASCAETETCRPAQPAQQIPGGAAGTATFSGPENPPVGEPPAAKHAVQAKKAAKPLTRAQKLARALRSCRKRYTRSKKRRAACERTATKRYGAKQASKHGTAGHKSSPKNPKHAQGARR